MENSKYKKVRNIRIFKSNKYIMLYINIILYILNQCGHTKLVCEGREKR